MIEGPGKTSGHLAGKFITAFQIDQWVKDRIFAGKGLYLDSERKNSLSSCLSTKNLDPIAPIRH